MTPDVNFAAIRKAIDERLGAIMDAQPEGDHDTAAAMRYSLLAPGKRLRGVLTVMVGECLGVDRERCLIPGCAIEMAHAASLVVDDLPCMDDATLRRGLPANHIRFGEDISILASVCLITEAFRIVSESDQLTADMRLRITALLSRSIGLKGLIGGQEKDLRGLAADSEAAAVVVIHRKKTAALFVAAAEAGAIVADASPENMGLVREFAERIGLAFQTLDDIIDTFGYANSAGKNTQQDAGRPNMVSIVGRDRALKDLMLQVQNAKTFLSTFGSLGHPLGQLAQSIFDGAWQLAGNGTLRYASAR